MFVNTAKVILRGVLFSVVFMANVVAQNYFNWQETEDYYPVIIDGATVNGVPVQDGDEIAVFFLNDSNQPTCGGAIIWPNQGLKSWGDDSQTAEKDGFSQSEQLVFKMYDVSRGEYIEDVISTWLIGNGSWGDGQYGKCTLNFNFVVPVELSFFEVY